MPKGSTPGNKTLLGGSAADQCDLAVIEWLINQIGQHCAQQERGARNLFPPGINHFTADAEMTEDEHSEPIRRRFI